MPVDERGRADDLHAGHRRPAGARGREPSCGWADPQTTGKPAGSDFAFEKKSLRVVAALVSGSREGEHLARMYGRDEKWDAAALTSAADLVIDAGAMAWARADRRIKAACTALQEGRSRPGGRCPTCRPWPL